MSATTNIHENTPDRIILDNGGEEWFKLTRDGATVIADSHCETVIDEDAKEALIAWLQRLAPKAGVVR